MTVVSPEQIAIRKERQTPLALNVEQEKILRLSIDDFDASRPQLKEFSDIYPVTEIQSDQAFIKKREAQFATTESNANRESKFLATVIEEIIEECGNGWLDASFSPASRYDDLHNGIDVVAEVDLGENQYLRFGIDVTTARQKVGQKLKLIKDDLGAGNFRELKYFRSDLGEGYGIAGQEIPKVVIYVDRPTALHLAKLYAQAEKMRQDHLPIKRRDEKMRAERNRLLDNLRRHFFGPKMHEQILAQLAVWQTEMARAVTQNFPEAKEKLDYLANLEMALNKSLNKQKSPLFGDEISDRSEQILIEILATV